MFLPMELVEKCVNSPVWVVNRNNREFAGTLMGFDDYLNLVLKDVTEFEKTATGEYTKTKLDTVLLNAKQVAMLMPGATGPITEA